MPAPTKKRPAKNAPHKSFVSAKPITIGHLTVDLDHEEAMSVVLDEVQRLRDALSKVVNRGRIVVERARRAKAAR